MNSRLFRRALSLAVTGVAAVLLVALSNKNRTLRAEYADLFKRSVESHPGLLVPVMELAAVDGEKLAIGGPAAGHKQVLFFFTTTCEYCLASLPAVQRIADALTGDSTAVLYGVALDSLPFVGPYVAEQQLRYPVGVASDRRVAALYRIRGVPQLTVVEDDGRVSYARQGVVDGPTVADSVLAALAAPAGARDVPADPPPISQPPGGR